MGESMKPKTDQKAALPPPTTEVPARRLQEFSEQLRRHPELLAEFESILALATETGADGHFRTADEVEALVDKAVRKLGHQTMGQWARGAQERAVEECKKEHPTARLKKKRR